MQVQTLGINQSGLQSLPELPTAALAVSINTGTLQPFKPLILPRPKSSLGLEEGQDMAMGLAPQPRRAVSSGTRVLGQEVGLGPSSECVAASWSYSSIRGRCL